MLPHLTDTPVSDLTCSFRPPRARVGMIGEFDVATRDHLADVLECLRLQGCTAVEVDAHEVSFVDASTLRVLHEEAVHLRRVDGALVVVAASETFARIVGLARYRDLVSAPTGREAASTPPIP